MSKSKFDLEIEEFEQAFSEFRSKKIVLYGTGRMTATLVGGTKTFQIIGLCDRDADMVGKEVYGKPILDRTEAESQADILVINTDATYWNTIYKRIQDWDIPIYFRNGKKASLPTKCNEENIYWEKDIQSLQRQIEEHEVISFDIFDTLLMRKVMAPIDVFRIVDERIKEKYGLLNFCAIRKQAAALQADLTYDEIYKNIEVLSGWSTEIVHNAKAWELETERKLIVARKDMVELCNKAMDNKEVYFVSDMYLSREILRMFLQEIGINAGMEQIIVSCECHREKSSGELWKWFQKEILKGRSALHIGDNVRGDVENPLKYGLDSYYVMSAQDMLKTSSISEIETQIESLQSSLVMGILCARLFNSPFALCETKGKLRFADEMEAGYVLLGNIAYNFNLWLLKQSKMDGVKQLLFVAREGFLLLPQYRYLCELLREKDAPKGIYLETSRRAVFGASIRTLENILEVAKFPFRGNAKEFLKERFGIEAEKASLEQIQMSEIQNNEQILCEFIKKYEREILENTRIERSNYLHYIESLKIGKKAGVVDSTLYGTTQYYLQKLTEQQLKGYYFCACMDESNPYYSLIDLKGCFQRKEDMSGKKCAMHNNSKFSEAFYTAPNGMLLYMKSDGTPYYAQNMGNQIHFDIRYIMQQGIFQYMDEMIKIQEEIRINRFIVDECFADDLYACLMNEGFSPTKEMKECFCFDNRILDKRESRIWEDV